MIGTMLGVLFVCLLGTVPIAVSLGLSCGGYILCL